MRPNVTPSTNDRDTKNRQPFVFDDFSGGTIQDPPASEIQRALADSKNLTIFPGFYEGRTGCRQFTETVFPKMAGRTGYAAHKVGNNIASDSGDIFSEDDVGNYWCWGSTFELIIAYNNPWSVTVESSTYYAGVDCSIQGSPNTWEWHKTLRQWVMLLGSDIYTAEWNIPSWDKVMCISKDIPFNTKSDFAEYKTFGYIFNGNGLFKIDMAASFPICYKVNLDPPNIKINSVPAFPGATARYRYLYSAARLEQESGIVDRQTPSRIDHETGGNVADSSDQDWSEVNTVVEISSAHPNLVTELFVPVVPNTDPLEYQWHLTHFPIYRTLDLEAKQIDDINKQKYNEPNRFIWVDDVRMCAAFYVMKDGVYFDALRGEFEVSDTHSILELDNGERFEIVEVISGTRVRVADDYYYGNNNDGPFAAAIGNGRVMRGTVTGDVLTRTHGGTFSSADVRKTIWNAEGYRFYITEYIDANSVRLHVNNGQPTQGFTMDPISRNFYDVADDNLLRARQDFYGTYGRYRKALPSTSLGTIMPGFVVCAFRGQKELYYSHLMNGVEYLIGNYIPTQLSEEVQDAIQFFRLFQDTLAIVCATSTYNTQVGLSEFVTLAGSNEAVAIMTGVKLIDKHIGSLDPGSVQEIGNGLVQMITNEPGGEAMRQFNGVNYSETNLLVDDTLGGRIMKALQKTKRMSAALYDGFLGYILWRKNRG